MNPPPITRIALYVRDMPKIAKFYETHFGFRATKVAEDKMVLTPANGGCTLALLQASRGHRIGQSCVKIIFDVDDVQAFKDERAKEGLKFGTIHRGPGYEFSNARDPAKNLIQISNSHLVEMPNS